MWKGILWPAIAATLLWLLAGGATSYYIHWQSYELDRLLVENISAIIASNKMEETIWRMQSVVMQSAVEGYSEQPVQLIDLEKQFIKSLVAVESVAVTTEEKELARQIRERFDHYADRWRHAMTDSTTTNAELLELLPLVPQITRPCEEVIRVNEQQVHSSSVQRRTLTSWIVWGRAITLFVGPAIGLFVGYRLAAHLRRSITSISVRLQSVAGDPDREVGQFEISSEVNFPSIQRQIDIVVDRMRAIVQELHQARQESIRSDRLAAVGELAAGVAHEIRNPLTSVKLLIQTAQHRQQEQIPNETFNIILEEISRMEATIQGLLDFARPPQLRRVRFDVRGIVKRAASLSDGRARQSHVELSLSCDNEPVWVNADAEQLCQVCVNVLLNGIEAMEAGGRLDITVNADQEGKRAILRFEDTGVGIPADLLPRIFEPFVSTKDHGTGLGLAVSRRIILNHNGSLTAENRGEGGACLTIQLPLDETAKERTEPDAHLIVG